jgi:hypothetical protein
MARKRWQAKTEITPSLLKFREKRKWQIALRRYVLEKNPSSFYAPYFGLDIENMRKWFEYQFENDTNWEDFGKKWQFDHIIPVAYFDFANDSELKLCWNFINLRVEAFQVNKNRGNRVDVLGAKSYFKNLYEKTQYKPCQELVEKITQIELSELISTDRQQSFIIEHSEYLKHIANYSSFEFELLNSGRPFEEVQKEIEFLKRYSK